MPLCLISLTASRLTRSTHHDEPSKRCSNDDRYSTRDTPARLAAARLLRMPSSSAWNPDSRSIGDVERLMYTASAPANARASASSSPTFAVAYSKPAPSAAVARERSRVMTRTRCPATRNASATGFPSIPVAPMNAIVIPGMCALLQSSRDGQPRLRWPAAGNAQLCKRGGERERTIGRDDTGDEGILGLLSG